MRSNISDRLCVIVHIVDHNYFFGWNFMNNNFLKLIFVFLWIIIVSASWYVDNWEINAKTGFSLLTFWIGIILGILVGIVSTKMKYTYK